MEARFSLLIAALFVLGPVPARAEDDERTRAAVALARQAQGLRDKAEELQKIASLPGSTADDPKLGEQLSSLASSLRAFQQAGGEAAKVSPLLSRVARLVYDVRLRQTGGPEPAPDGLVDLDQKPRVQPLGAPFINGHLAALREVATETEALAGLGGVPIAVDRDLRDGPNAGLLEASKRIGAITGIDPGRVFDAPAGERALGLRVAPTAALDDTKALSHYQRGRRVSYDHDVYADQLYLKALGYEVGALDGKHGPTLDAAIRKFKQDMGRGDDGDVTALARSDLRALALQRGIDIPANPVPPLDRREGLTLVHYKLNRALGADLAASSRFGNVALGPVTRRRITEFQKSHDLKPTGDLDQATWDRLSAEASKPLPPIQENDEKRVVQGARITVYYPGRGRPSREGPPNDRFGDDLCTADKYARGGCDAITVAIDRKLQVGRGTPVQSPQLEAAYTQQCKAAGLPCDRPPRFEISDVGSCKAFHGDGHIDIATESTEAEEGFGRAFDLHGATLIFPRGFQVDPTLSTKCGRTRTRRRRRKT